MRSTPPLPADKTNPPINNHHNRSRYNSGHYVPLPGSLPHHSHSIALGTFRSIGCIVRSFSLPLSYILAFAYILAFVLCMGFRTYIPYMVCAPSLANLLATDRMYLRICILEHL